MITAKMAKTLTDFEGKDIEGLRKGDTVKIIGVNGSTLLVERDDAEEFVAMLSDVVVRVAAEQVEDFTKKLILLVKSLEAYATYRILAEVVPGIGGEGMSQDMDAAFTKDLLVFVDAMSRVSA